MLSMISVIKINCFLIAARFYLKITIAVKNDRWCMRTFAKRFDNSVKIRVKFESNSFPGGFASFGEDIQI